MARKTATKFYVWKLRGDERPDYLTPVASLEDAENYVVEFGVDPREDETFVLVTSSRRYIWLKVALMIADQGLTLSSQKDAWFSDWPYARPGEYG